MALALAAAPAWGHTPTPEQVIAAVTSSASRTELDVTTAARDATPTRLLLVRVGPRWSTVDPARRRAAAEEWHRRWRETVPQGIVAVLDAAADEPVVSFDASGRARLRAGAQGQ